MGPAGQSCCLSRPLLLHSTNSLFTHSLRSTPLYSSSCNTQQMKTSSALGRCCCDHSSRYRRGNPVFVSSLVLTLWPGTPTNSARAIGGVLTRTTFTPARYTLATGSMLTNSSYRPLPTSHTVWVVAPTVGSFAAYWRQV